MRSSTQGCSPTGKVVIDDAGAIFAGLPLSLPLPQYTTSLVVEEVKDEESRKVLERGIVLERIKVIDPPAGYIDKARTLAKSFNTLNKLSKTDLQVFALALYLSEETNCEVLVATDDYALQHTVTSAGLKIIKVRYKGIRIS